MARGTRSTPTPAEAPAGANPTTGTTAQGTDNAADREREAGEGSGESGGSEGEGTGSERANESADDTLNRPLDTDAERTQARASEAVGSDPTTQHGADAPVASATTEVARVDQVEITRVNQGLIDPRQHGDYAPPQLGIANRPAGSEPVAIDLETGLPAKQQLASEDKERLADLKREAEG